MPTICLWNRCNSNCIMCTNPNGFQDKRNSRNYTSEKILGRAESFTTGSDNINLTGGEPTIHPEFLKLLKELRYRFPINRIVIDTNGRRFYYRWFTKRCLDLPNLNFLISLHGYNAKTHDSITRSRGSFDQTIQGIRNILRYRNRSHQLEIRIIITKLTYKYVEKILNLIKNEFPQVDRIVLIFMEMEGQAGRNFEIVGVTYQEVKKYLPGMAKWIGKFKEMRFYHFPLCVIDPSLWKYTWRTLPDDEVTFLPQCNKCLYKKYCLGIHKDYLKKIGGKEFKPIRKKMSIRTINYFHHPIIEVRKTAKTGVI